MNNNSNVLNALRAVALLSAEERKEFFEVVNGLTNNTPKNATPPPPSSNAEVVLDLRNMSQRTISRNAIEFVKVFAVFGVQKDPLQLAKERYVLYRSTRPAANYALEAAVVGVSDMVASFFTVE